MKLKYCVTPRGNFGDDLNLLLWPELFPDLAEHHASVRLYGIGTILGGRHDGAARKVVLGSGLGEAAPPRLDGNWDFQWVRGPLSAQRLGVPLRRALGDSAWLWSGLQPGCDEAGALGLIPHHGSWESFDWTAVADHANLLAIDPNQAPGEVVAQLRHCSRVLTESLHGAIFADAMGIPWAPCVFSHRFNYFKWQDWLAVVQRPFAPFVADRPLVRQLSLAKALANRLARWTGHGGCSRPSALRAVRPSTMQDVVAVADRLVRFGGRSGSFACSDARFVARQRYRMIEACAGFAQQYGLRFIPA